MESKSVINKELKINCEIVQSTDHYKILYELLKNRKHSISHKEMPTYEEHEEFCKNNPYRLWFILFSGDSPIGTFYLTEDNRIGINLIDGLSIKSESFFEFSFNMLKRWC